MTILHGDDRVYNNIIVQKYPVTEASIGPDSADHQAAGTAPFDIFPSYEEWISGFMMDRGWDFWRRITSATCLSGSGEAYFNGALSAGRRRFVCHSGEVT